MSKATSDCATVASKVWGLNLKDFGFSPTDDIRLPSRSAISELCVKTLDFLFPGYFNPGIRNQTDHAGQIAGISTSLLDNIRCTQRFVLRGAGKSEDKGLTAQCSELIAGALDDLVKVRELLATDVQAAFANDPAASDREVVVVSYPCIEALAVQRFAHCLYRREVPLIPRMMTEVAHGRTGIDIHPGASIGESFFIDHGTGVVIGETAVIGKHCVLYQGVGLIAWNPLAKDEHGELKRGQSNKRHPELQDHVTVYANASILGGDTVIGHHSVIGGNVWLTHSVEPYSVVTIKDPELDIRKRKSAPRG